MDEVTWGASAQVLYQHLSQPRIDLNWAPDGPGFKLTDAIRHSLRTPGALLHTRLQARSCIEARAHVPWERFNSCFAAAYVLNGLTKDDFQCRLC